MPRQPYWLNSKPPRLWRTLAREASAMPREKPPTPAEATRLDPLMPLIATGQLPLDPMLADKARRWFEQKYQTLRRTPPPEEGSPDDEEE